MGGSVLANLLAGGLDDFALSGLSKVKVGQQMQPYKFDVSHSRFNHMPGLAENMRLARPKAEKYAKRWDLGDISNLRADGDPMFVEIPRRRPTGQPLTMQDVSRFLSGM